MSIVQKGINDLATFAPDISLEWHPVKNGSLTPDMVSRGSKKKAWWLGKCGHEWQADIYSRVTGRGCPYCSGKRVLEGFNDFASQMPELLKEWNYDKNKDIKPNTITVGSHIKAYWKCSICGNEWQAAVKNRVNGTGCPACYRRNRTSFPEQSFFYYIHLCYPDAINGYSDIFENSMELDVFIPSIKTAIEYDGYHWHKENQFRIEEKKYQICKANKIILIRIKEVSETPNTIPNCDYYITIPAKHSSVDLDTAIKTLGNYFPLDVDVDTNRDHIGILRQYYQIIQDGSIANVAPRLIMEWHPTKNEYITPEMVRAGSNQKVWWKCSVCGHEWTAVVCNRVNGSGCPACARKQLEKARIDTSLSKTGSIADTHPQLIAEWMLERNAPLSPDTVTIGSSKKIWWKCANCGHEWQATIYNRVRGTGCPICKENKQIESYKKTKLEKNGTLAITHPQLVLEWNQTKNGSITPEMVHAGSRQKAWWICQKCGNEWQALISSRANGSSCPNCRKTALRNEVRQRSINNNGSLKDTCPQLSKEWLHEKNLPLTPNLVTKGSNQKVWWKCTNCGHEWQAQIYNRAKGTGCPQCMKQKQLDSFEKTIIQKRGSLKETYPSLAEEWNKEKNGSLSPDMISKGSNRKVWWKCANCGHEWQATVSSRSLGHGCPNCYKMGIKSSK